MSGIIVGILLLSVIMIFHELGHYATGRRLGFKVEEFSLFMGPVLLSYEKKGIKYSLKLFPIGASCRFAGEEEDNPEAADALSDRSDEGGARFFDRPRSARAAVLTAGAAMNYLTGILAFFIMFSWFGFVTTSVAQLDPVGQASAAGIQPGEKIVSVNGARIRTQLDYDAETAFIPQGQPMDVSVSGSQGDSVRTVRLVPERTDVYQLGIMVDLSGSEPTITEVSPDSNEGSPVLRENDIIVAVNDVLYEDTAAFSEQVRQSGGEPVTVTVRRDGVRLNLETTPVMQTLYNSPGIQFEMESSAIQSVGEAVRYSWSIVRFTVKGLSMMIAGEIAARDSLAGPIGIVSMVGEVVDEERPVSDKIYSLLAMFGLISVNLAFMNLLPIPPLDGNHLLLTGLEAIRGRRLSVRTQTVISVIGFSLLIGLAIVAVVFDVMRLSGG